MTRNKREGKDNIGRSGLAEGLEKSRERFLRLERTEDLVQEASKAIAERDSLLGAVFTNSLDGMFVIDLKGNYLDVNPAGCRMFGYSKDEFLSSDIRLLLFPEDVKPAFDLLKSNLENNPGEGHLFPEYRMRHKDGSEVWVEFTATPFRLGTDDLILGIKRDITEKRLEMLRLLEDMDELESAVEERTRELKETNSALGKEIKERARVEKALRTITEATSMAGGEDFLRSLVTNLATALKFSYTFVGEVTGDRLDKVRTLALWAKGSLVDNFEYYLKGTPCENVVGEKICYYSMKVAELFPEDYLLVEMGVESYLGVPLKDSTGSVLGILVGMNDVPIKNAEELCEIFEVFASRAAFELERKRLEEEGKKSEELLQALMDNSPAAILIKDAEGRFLFVNSWFERYFGLPKEEMIGKTDYDILPEETAERLMANDKKVIESGRPMEFEDEVLLGDGMVHTFLTVKFPIPAIPGAVCAIATDITGMKRADQMLRTVVVGTSTVAGEEFFVSLVRHIAAALNFRYAFIGEIIGEEEEVVRTMALWKDGEIAENIEYTLADSPCRCEANAFDCTFITRNAKERFCRNPYFQDLDIESYICIRFPGPSGSPGGILVAMDDKPVQEDPRIVSVMKVFANRISTELERIRSEERHRKSEERLKEAQKQAGLGSWEWDIVKDETYHSEEMNAIIGRTEEDCELDYNGFLKIICPDDRENFERAVTDALAGRKDYSVDFRIVLPDGTMRFVHDQAKVVRDENGEPLRMVGTLQDITERKQAEEELRRSEERFREAQRIARIGSWEWNIINDETYRSDEIYEIFGRAEEECASGFCGFLDVVHPDDRGYVERALKIAIAEGEGYSADFRVILSDGSVRFVHDQARVICDENGKALRMIGTSQDITERKILERELLKAQKLESLGEMAGGIAHEFNNLLLGIIGNVSVAKNYIAEDHKVSKLLNKVEDAATKTKALTRQLLTFSRGGAPVTEVCSVAELVGNTSSMVLKDMAVNVEYHFPPDLSPVKVDEGQMSQVISNVVLNAAQAVEEGGKIYISANNVKGCEGTTLRSDCVKITVKDTGCGIPRDNIQKIFDPFFTTKEKASGLGLAVAYSIVKKHGGEVTVVSKCGKGTSFHICLPAFKGDGTEGAAWTEVTIHGAGSEVKAIRPGEVAVKEKRRVLMMDDEELVRDVAAEMLELLGFDAEFATEGVEAVEIYKKAMEEDRPFAAVIMDLTVPGGMGGVEAVKKLLDIDPEARVIVSSGYSRDSIMGEYKKYGFKAVIKKPYRVAEFNKVVREVVDGSV